MKAHSSSDNVQQRRHRNRLFQILKRAVFDRTDRGLEGWQTGHEDDRYVQVAFPDITQKLNARAARHVNITDNHIKGLLLNSLGRLDAVPGSLDRPTFRYEHRLGYRKDRWIIIHK